MNQWPAHVEPLDRAILDLLCSLPSTWGDYDAEALSGSEQEAIRRMVRAGLVELRLIVRATMDGRDELVELTLTVTGEYDGADIWRAILEQVPDWLDADGRTRGRCQMWSDPRQIRLTDQGEVARHDYVNQTPENPSSVCAFVRRLGFFAHRHPVPPRIRVESCSVNARSGGDRGPTVAAAAAKATVGDITIQNNIQLDHGVIVEQILAEMDKRQEAAPSEPDDRSESETGSADRTDPPIPKMNDAVRRAGESLEWVQRERPELAPGPTTKERYTREQYDHIREHGGLYPLDDHNRTTVPAWDTWSRYVREYLRLTEGRVNFPRRGRTGRSLVRPDELDEPRGDD
jgi:hypothetical protein